MINNSEYRTCNICGLTDTRCKICKCEYQKKRRLLNKEKNLDLQKKEDLRDKVLKNMCSYYENKIELLEKEIKNIHRNLNMKENNI